MLVNLKIKNFGLISDIEIPFKGGMTTIIGESGSGKSLFIQALNILMGAAANSSIIKSGHDSCFIIGYFTIKESLKEILKQKYDIAILPEEKNLLFIQRVIKRNSTSYIKVQNKKISLKKFKEFSKELINIHEQHENLQILSPSNYLTYIDSCMHDKSLLMKYKKNYELYLKQKEIYENLNNIKKDLGRLEIYKKQLLNIEELNLQENELDYLKKRSLEINKINNNLKTFLEIKNIFTNNDLLSNLYLAKDLLNKLDYDKESNIVENCYFELQEIADKISQDIDSIIDIKEELSNLQQRMDQIFSMQALYGEDLCKQKQYLEDKIYKLENLEYDLQQSKKNLKEIETNIFNIANKLTSERKKISNNLVVELEKLFSDLNMKNTKLKISFKKIDFNDFGSDKIDFQIKTNLGTDFSSLRKIVSGGELSRIVLCFKILFSRYNKINTIVFDEIDTGIGGITALKTATLIKDLSRYLQVIVISHTPQVIAAGDNVINIIKKDENTDTNIYLKNLNKHERINSLALLLSGEKITENSLNNARELIDYFS